MRRAGAALAVSLLTLLLFAPDAGAAKTDVNKQVASAKAQANAAAARLSNAQSSLAKAEADIAELTTDAAESRRKVEALQGQVKALAVHRYMGGAAGITLASGDPSAIARTDAIIRLITVGATDALDAYRMAKADFDSTRRALTSRLADRRAAVTRLRGDQRKAIAELDRLDKLLVSLERAARTRPASRTSRASGVIVTGNWVCPVQGAHSFTNDWGAPRSGGRGHEGTDILAKRGTPVVANVSGVFSRNSSNKGGLSYYLKGNDGNTYFGAHLDSYSGAGGSVPAGTVIGYVGDTGNARGGPPHLHFEIHPGGGGAVNPYSTLVRYC